MASIRGAIDPSPKPFRGSWEGETKIVIGIDIGTTQSGVAFAFLQQGANQIIHRVTRWPGQEAESQKSKIPTVVWYDSNGKAVSFGAEALSEQAEEDAEDNNWKLAKHFKLLLHPEDMKLKHDLKVEELPTGVSLRQVYSDFLGYLIRQTQVFFEDRILDGKQVWETYKPTTEVVIAHPNGWGVREQALLRSAAVEAKLSSAENASKQVRFVTEAEASVHFCIYHTNLGERLKPGTNFAVCDAGGSTVDTTLYSVISVRPELKLQEKRASACVQAGAIFVDAEAEKYIRNAFKNAELSTEDTEEYTKAGVKDFESFAKRVFRDTAADQSVTITNSRYNNPAIRTRRGRMVLPGPTVKSFFDVCSNEIFISVDEQLDSYNVPYILLVGGFGDSPFLRQEFKNRYGPKGTQVTLTNDSTSKAVADGAVIWNVISSVSSRAPRFAFGIITSTMFDFRDHEHWGRIKYTSADGISRVAGVWDQIVAKGIALDAEAVCRQSACQLFKSARPDLEHYTSHLFSYSGDDKPEWAMNHRGILESNFQGACTITADMQNLSGALTRHIGIHGKPFWELAFDVCIRFGGTELEAYLEWEEKGKKRTGPATIVPDDGVEA